MKSPESCQIISIHETFKEKESYIVLNHNAIMYEKIKNNNIFFLKIQIHLE